MKKWIIATYLFYQSKAQFNYWSKWLNMKNGKFHCFVDAHEEDQHAANVQ